METITYLLSYDVKATSDLGSEAPGCFPHKRSWVRLPMCKDVEDENDDEDGNDWEAEEGIRSETRHPMLSSDVLPRIKQERPSRPV